MYYLLREKYQKNLKYDDFKKKKINQGFQSNKKWEHVS